MRRASSSYERMSEGFPSKKGVDETAKQSQNLRGTQWCWIPIECYSWGGVGGEAA